MAGVTSEKGGLYLVAEEIVALLFLKIPLSFLCESQVMGLVGNNF